MQEEQKQGSIGTRIAYIMLLGVPIGLFIFLIRSLNPPAVDPPKKNPLVQQRRTVQTKIEPSPIQASDALIEAAHDGDRATVQRELQAGVDVNYQNNYGWTALMFAAFSGHTPVVQLLLDAGAHVDLRNITGKTALMWATWKGHTPVVQLLLEAGANVDFQDKHSSARGETALMKAEKKGHTDITQLLRAHGATL